jgi:hypothetical protein
MPMSTVSQISEGVWLVKFPTKEDVVAERCAHLLPPLIEASKAGPIVLLAVPPPDLRMVQTSMSTFWLDAFTTKGVNVCGVGIVTHSSAVRVVLRGIGLALSLRNKPIATQAHDTVDSASNWAAALIKAKRSAPKG